MERKTEFIQNDAEQFLADNCCDECHVKLSDAYDTDNLGCIEVFGVYDKNNDDLIGFLCPECADKKLEPLEYYQSEDEYEAEITECFGVFKIGELTFEAGKILRELDEIAFHCGISDSMKYQCPICEAVHEDHDDAKECCQDW